MKKDEIFFGGAGMTSTSANYTANLAKQYVSSLEKQLQVNATKTTLKVIGSDEESTIRKGDSDDKLDTLEAMLLKISAGKSLCAWVREALKAKERLVKEAKEIGADSRKFCSEILKQEYPEPPVNDWDEAEPRLRETLTEDDILGEKSIAYRNKYFRLQTEAAVIGKYIHPGGSFDKEREDLMEKIQNPTKVMGSGRDTLIEHYEPSMTPDKVHETYFKLQALQRQKQAEFNSMQHSISETIQADERAAENEYLTQMAEYRARHSKWQEEYSAKREAYRVEVKSIEDQAASWLIDELKRIGDLKIIIPDDLKKIYDEVSHLGK